jgi:opacity protein-like surface antigen
MRRALRAFLLTAAVALVWAPAPVSAEGFISPWAGVNFGSEGLEGNGSYGVTGGYMGAGVIGGEVDFGYSPNPFGDVEDNSMITLMGNVIIGIPIGGTSGVGVRPYGTAGVGLLRQHRSEFGAIPEFSNNDFGFNLGAGLMGFFNDHVGLRGDLRYFRDFQADTSDDGLNIDLGAFDFWRASIGVVFR